MRERWARTREDLDAEGPEPRPAWWCSPWFWIFGGVQVVLFVLMLLIGLVRWLIRLVWPDAPIPPD